MCALLSEVLLRVDKVLVDYIVDVAVVGVEELLYLPRVRVVEEQSQMLKISVAVEITGCYNHG